MYLWENKIHVKSNIFNDITVSAFPGSQFAKVSNQVLY